MNRRTFLTTGIGVSAAAVAGLNRIATSRALASSETAGWRVFEVTTRLEIVNPGGAVRAWLPMPLVPDTDYQRGLGHTWTGNATSPHVIRDEKYGASILAAEWPAGETAPVIEVITRHATRDRVVDLKKPAGNPAPEDKKTLALYLAPSRLIVTDGIVAKTSREITKGGGSDVDKARAIYEWIVENTFRDPKVRGCGIGDIRGMLETGNLGGKCADLNALFVGLARASGIPARDIYGIRAADSAEFKSLGKSGDISKAQHCRAEFYSASHGWVPVDPADVRKVVLEERPGGIALGDPQAQRARAKLFGAWEMNYLAYNYAHDLKLPGSSGDPIAFLMYPQAETVEGRRDSLDPDSFRYKIASREIKS